MCTGYCDHIDPCPYFISFSYILAAFFLLTSPLTFLSVLNSLSLIKITLWKGVWVLGYLPQQSMDN